MNVGVEGRPQWVDIDEIAAFEWQSPLQLEPPCEDLECEIIEPSIAVEQHRHLVIKPQTLITLKSGATVLCQQPCEEIQETIHAVASQGQY